MPDIPVGAQIFDIAFHPNRPIVYTGLLTGHIKAFGYDEQGNHEPKFSLRPSKKSCRALALSVDGDQLWAAGKAKAIQCVSLPLKRTRCTTYTRYRSTIDVGTGEVVDTRAGAHE